MKFFSAVILLHLLTLTVNAQEKLPDSSGYKYWMTAGMFFGDNNTSLNLNYSFSLGNGFIKAAYFERGAFGLSGIVFDDRGYKFHTFDVCYGKRVQSEWFQAAGFLGLAHINGEKRKENNRSAEFTTVGLQADAQFLFRLADEIGLGFNLYGNLNGERPYTGMSFNLTIGNGR